MGDRYQGVRTVGKSMMCVSRSGSAMCQQLNVFPKNLMSSEGIFGCGWLKDMPSSSACAGRFSRQLLCLAGGAGIENC